MSLKCLLKFPMCCSIHKTNIFPDVAARFSAFCNYTNVLHAEKSVLVTVSYAIAKCYPAMLTHSTCIYIITFNQNLG